MHSYQPFVLTLCGRLAYTEHDPQHEFQIAALRLPCPTVEVAQGRAGAGQRAP